MAGENLLNEVLGFYQLAEKRGAGKGWLPYKTEPTNGLLAKAGGTVSDMAGAINIVYGAPVIDQQFRSVNAHAATKKEDWGKSGWRTTETALTTKLYGGMNPGTVGTDLDIAPVERSSLPGFVHTPFAVTTEALFQTGHDDGVNAMEYKQAIMRDVHVHGLNQQILKGTRNESTNVATTNAKANGTAVGIESYDRLIASAAEVTATNAADTTDASWYAIYTEGASIARTSATVNDSVVLKASGSATLTGMANSTFALSALDSLIQQTEANGAEEQSSMILTGYDTREKVYAELKAQGRYDMTVAQAKIGMNGISVSGTHDGRDITTAVRVYRGRPILGDKEAPKELTANDATTASRLFLIDQRYFRLKMGFPTYFIEADNPFYLNAFKSRALYATAEQLIGKRFNTSGKLVAFTA